MAYNYIPIPEHKFTFGLWTIGNIGRNPFGGPVRETKSPVGAGAWSDVESACKTAIKLTGSRMPNPEQVEAYRKAYPLYRELYPVLKSSFEKMTS